MLTTAFVILAIVIVVVLWISCRAIKRQGGNGL